MVKLSLEELNLLYPLSGFDAQISFIKTQFPQKLFLITQGSAGATVIKAGQVAAVPSIKVHQVDATGAGDAFLGAFVAQLLVLLDHQQFDDLSITSITDMTF